MDSLLTCLKEKASHRFFFLFLSLFKPEYEEFVFGECFSPFSGFYMLLVPEFDLANISLQFQLNDQNRLLETKRNGIQLSPITSRF